MKNKLWFFTCLLCAQAVCGQVRLTDLPDREEERGSYPNNFVEFRDRLFFEAANAEYGRELWVTDGLPGEAQLLRDFFPGKMDGMRRTFASTAVVLKDALYFFAATEFSKGELWKTDGTAAGTEQVTDFIDGEIDALTLVNGALYFLRLRDQILQVWTSDGTATGTRIVKDELPIWNQPTYQGQCNDAFIFTFQNYGSNDSRVWRSDGTATGTYPITEELEGNIWGRGPGASPTQYIMYRNELYFASYRYLYKTDAAAEKATRLVSLDEVSRPTDYGDVAEANGKLYFSFYSGESNHLLIYKTDGSASGSSRVYSDHRPEYFTTSNLLPWGDSLLFCGGNATGGTSLLSLNLTDYSVDDIKTVAEAPQPTVYRGKGCHLQRISEEEIFCAAPGRDFSYTGWLSGLTEETTRPVKELEDVTKVFPFAGSSYFAKYSKTTQYELWRSNRKHDEFYLLDNLNPDKYGIAHQPLLTLDSSLLFIDSDLYRTSTFWSLNASSGSLRDISGGATRSRIGTPVLLNGEVVFVATDSTYRYQLWATDGTEEGARRVTGIPAGTSTTINDQLILHGDSVYFVVYRDGHDHLYKSDGYTAEHIRDMGEDDFGVPVRVMTMASSGSLLYLLTAWTGADIWRSDGTAAGTFKIGGVHNCEELTDVDGRLFFTATEGYTGGRRLYTSNGTEATTTLVMGPDDAWEPNQLTNYNGTLIFTASTPESGREVWQSDGTTAGTVPLADINAGPASSVAEAHFSVVGNTLFFSARDVNTGFELWKTDGSTEGTKLVRDICAGRGSSLPSQGVAIGEALYFQARDSAHGFELWTSDGTAAGTQLLADVVSGPTSSFPGGMTAIGDRLFFTAESPGAGRQIWRLGPGDSTTTATHVPPAKNARNPAYPNPTSGRVILPDVMSEGPVSIYTAEGRLLKSVRPNYGVISLADLPSGLYFLSYPAEGKRVVSSVIKH